MLPLAISCAPFGVAVGATIAASNVDVAPKLAAALLMFGGSAQLAAVEMLDAGATPVLIVAAAAIINARFVAYSAGLAPLFPTTSRGTRAVMATTLVDQSYLLTSIDATNHDRSEPQRVRFYLGASATIGLIWIAAQVLGVMAGTALPKAANLGAAAPISLAGLAAGVVFTRPSRRALTGAALGMIVLSSVAAQFALIAAIVVGITIAARATSVEAGRV